MHAIIIPIPIKTDIIAKISNATARINGYNGIFIIHQDQLILSVIFATNKISQIKKQINIISILTPPIFVIVSY